MEKNIPYNSKMLSRESQNLDKEEITSIVNLLESNGFKELISQGKITLAMIRPNVGPDANLLGMPDLEAAEEIEKKITGLGFSMKFSFVWPKESITEFYDGGPKASMQKEKPIDPAKYPTRWEEFVDFMSSAPTTIIYLFDPDNEAIKKWRDHLGHWNIDQVRDPSTIRGSFGVNKYNNLVHGSDSSDSVSKETGMICSALRKIANE